MPEIVEKHLMLDLETVGQGARAAILEIGALAFDPYGELLGDYAENTNCFYKAINLDSCFKLGLEADNETILWWFNQDEAARVRQVTAQRVVIGTAAEALRKFCQDNMITHVWSHGAGFDATIMEEVYRLLRKDVPWDFRKVRDTRTLFGLTDLSDEKWQWLLRRPFKHHPVCDAWAQARAVQYCLTGEEDGTAPANENTVGVGALAA